MTSDPSHTRRQVAKGTAWAVAMRFSVRGLGVISTIILARLLVPADFGLVALAMMVAGLLEMMTAIGIEAALISDQKAERAHYDTAWTMRALKGAVVGVFLAGLAGPAAGFFDQPNLEAPIYWLALAAFVQGFENIGTVDFLKHLRFDRDFVFLVVKKLSSFLITVTLAFMWRSYWALIAGIVAGKFFGVGLSYLMSTYRPRISFAAWDDIFGFSKWNVAREFLNYVSQRLDTFFLGKFASSSVLGLYTVASEVAFLPFTELTAPLTRAIFPGLSRLQTDTKEFRRLLCDSMAVATIVAVPVAIGLSLVAEPLTVFVLGEKWREAVPLLELLALASLASIVNANSASAFLAIRRPDVLARLVFLMLFVRIPVLLWAIMSWGALGAAYGILGLSALQICARLVLLSRFSLLSCFELLKNVWRSGVACAVMTAVILAVGETTTPFDHPGVELIVLVLLGSSVYLITVLGLWLAQGRPDGPERIALSLSREGLERLSQRGTPRASGESGD